MESSLDRTWDAKKLQKSDLKISSLWFPSSVVKFKHLRNKAVFNYHKKSGWEAYATIP